MPTIFTRIIEGDLDDVIDALQLHDMQERMQKEIVV